MDHVFMVMLDWSTTDADGFQIELFKNYDDAYDRFKEIISEQLKEFWEVKSILISTAIPAKNMSFPKKTTIRANRKFIGIFPVNTITIPTPL